jgi:hypothetical protein
MVNQIEHVVGIIETEDYKFTLTELSGILFCHIDIKNWSIDVYKSMLIDFSSLRENLENKLNCLIDKQNKQGIKIAKMFGFYEIMENKEQVILRL